MNRSLFLTLASIIALAVGSFALLQPALLLQSKGIGLNAAANVWMQETGIALVSIGVAALLLRGQPDSPTLRAFLIGNTVLQVGLLTIELMAFAEGVITRLSGVAQNCTLHVVFAMGFAYDVASMKASAPAGTRGH
jgi:hypothetical protein